LSFKKLKIKENMTFQYSKIKVLQKVFKLFRKKGKWRNSKVKTVKVIIMIRVIGKICLILIILKCRLKKKLTNLRL